MLLYESVHVFFFLIFTFSFYPYRKRMAKMFRKLSVPVTITENKFSDLCCFPTHMYFCLSPACWIYCLLPPAPAIPIIFQSPSASAAAAVFIHPRLPLSEKGLLDTLGFPWWSEQKQTVEPPQRPGLAKL